MNVLNGLYIAYFWKNVTYEMLEDILDYDPAMIASYIVEMGKYFYENEIQQCNSFGLPSLYSVNVQLKKTY